MYGDRVLDQVIRPVQFLPWPFAPLTLQQEVAKRVQELRLRTTLVQPKGQEEQGCAFADCPMPPY